MVNDTFTIPGQPGIEEIKGKLDRLVDRVQKRRIAAQIMAVLVDESTPPDEQTFLANILLNSSARAILDSQQLGLALQFEKPSIADVNIDQAREDDAKVKAEAQSMEDDVAEVQAGDDAPVPIELDDVAEVQAGDDGGVAQRLFSDDEDADQDVQKKRRVAQGPPALEKVSREPAVEVEPVVEEPVVEEPAIKTEEKVEVPELADWIKRKLDQGLKITAKTLDANLPALEKEAEKRFAPGTTKKRDTASDIKFFYAVSNLPVPKLQHYKIDSLFKAWVAATLPTPVSWTAFSRLKLSHWLDFANTKKTYTGVPISPERPPLRRGTRTRQAPP